MEAAQRPREFSPTPPVVAGGIKYVQRGDSGDVAHGSSQNHSGTDASIPEAKGNLKRSHRRIGWGDTHATVTGVSDSEGNTYVASAPPTVTGNVGLSQVDWYYAKNIKGDGVTHNTITVNFNTPGRQCDRTRCIRVLEYSGLDTSAPLDAATGVVGAFSSTASSAIADYWRHLRRYRSRGTGCGWGYRVRLGDRGPDPDTATPIFSR